MSTDHDQPIAPQSSTSPPSPPHERRSNRTAWTALVVVALVALLTAVIFYAKQSRDREDQITSDYACALQAEANGATSWQVIDGRCVTR